MAAPARFADVLDSKTRGTPPALRPMGLWAPQSVWLYTLPAVDLEHRRPSADWVSVTLREEGTRATPAEPCFTAAAAWQRKSRADDFGAAVGDAAPPRPPRVLSAGARTALNRLRCLGASNLDDGFTHIELKRAFRRLAMRLHPDRHPHASHSERARLAREFSAMTDAVSLLLASV